jgi:hypothetical protein
MVQSYLSGLAKLKMEHPEHACKFLDILTNETGLPGDWLMLKLEMEKGSNQAVR